jgi:hypothetical protein
LSVLRDEYVRDFQVFCATIVRIEPDFRGANTGSDNFGGAGTMRTKMSAW